MVLRRRIRWAVQHGLLRRMVRRQLGQADPTARLILDPAVRHNPFPYYDQLRARGRIVRGGLALLSAHHDICLSVLRSPDFGPPRLAQQSLLFRLARRFGGRQVLGPVEPPSLLAVDPPEHTRYRKLVNRAFSARAVAALRPRIEEIARELLDEITRAGQRDHVFDLVESYASLLPATVIAEILGAPISMRRQFLTWGAGAALSLDAGLSYRDFCRCEHDLTALHRWMLNHFAEIRHTPRDGILSELVAAHDRDDLTSTDELSSLAMLLLAAGFETTVNLLGNGAVLLMRHRDALQALQADPQHWPGAVEEILRYESPVQRTGRLAKRDTLVAGQRVAAGSFIILLLGAANRDPAVFCNPHRFDIHRPEAGQHLAFSTGIHHCIGAALARLEGEVGLRVLFERFPALALAATPHRRPTRVLYGYDAIPVRLPCPAPAIRPGRSPARE